MSAHAWRTSKPSARTEPLKVLLSAGEASGDTHGSEVVRHLLGLAPGASVFGMGGSKLRAAGMETVVDAELSANVMGVTDVVRNFKKIKHAFYDLLALADERKPDVAVLIDYPDFNLRLARKLHQRGIKVLYFIGPTLWAWRKGRVKLFRRFVTKVATIFPFEEHVYHQHGVDAEFVGHPFMDRPPVETNPFEFLTGLGLDPARPTVALLPGSRVSEIRGHLPAMLDAFSRLTVSRPGLQGVMPVASSLDIEWVRSMVPGRVVLVPGRAREVLEAATVGIASSGSATMEAALAGLPCVVVYRMSELTYAVAKRLVRGVHYIAMPNIIAGKEIYRELIQDDVTGNEIARATEVLLGDPSRRERVREELRVLAGKLRPGGMRRNNPTEIAPATKRVAEIITELTS